MGETGRDGFASVELLDGTGRESARASVGIFVVAGHGSICMSVDDDGNDVVSNGNDDVMVLSASSASTNAGFKRSIEIICGFPWIDTLKYLSCRSITSKGPSYGWTRAARNRSTRTKTCEHDWRLGCTNGLSVV